MNQQQESLENLRTAAEQDQWNECRENITRLLPELEPVVVMKMIAKFAQRFLSDVSRLNPEDQDLTKAIELFNDIESLEAFNRQGKLAHEPLENYWKWPGVSNFRNSLKGISKPQQYFEHDGEYKDVVVSVISGILMAININAYWGGNPEFSKTFFGDDNRAVLHMLVKADKDPKNVEIRRLLWTDVADEIEAGFQGR